MMRLLFGIHLYFFAFLRKRCLYFRHLFPYVSSVLLLFNFVGAALPGSKSFLTTQLIAPCKRFLYTGEERFNGVGALCYNARFNNIRVVCIVPAVIEAVLVYTFHMCSQLTRFLRICTERTDKNNGPTCPVELDRIVKYGQLRSGRQTVRNWERFVVLLLEHFKRIIAPHVIGRLFQFEKRRL